MADGDEQRLVEELSSKCTPLGDERRSCLGDSSDVLLRMGMLYTRKAGNSAGMAQKLNLIKSAALLYGARVRFRHILRDFRKCNQVYLAIMEMEKTLHGACVIGKFTENLVEISKHLHKLLERLRKQDRKAVRRLEKIDRKVMSSDQLYIRQKQKIFQVEDIMKTNTDNYLSLMKAIAEKCSRFLGCSPCKFALVGLGSLARSEITLYSDFEHVIVLEDGIETSLNFENILEYFRWFATIFHIIIVGLGETFIRSIGVKSINDLYSDDKSKNWYYDVFTPCGVSFDGMVPHSCNHPLGRQEPTKNKKHVVELIQPADKMAKFLTSEQHLKNGYYLKDVLSRTCFVYGDKGVYQDFRRLSNDILISEPKHEVIADQVKNLRQNVNTSIRRLHSTLPVGVDIKSSYYRPITALLAFWSRLRGFKSYSSFGIASEIENLTHNKKDTHRIRYAVAIACELRLKAYTVGGNQRQDMIGKEVQNFVGLECAVECMSTIESLSFKIDRLLPHTRNVPREVFSYTYADGSGYLLGESQIYLQLKFYEEAERILEKKLKQNSNKEPSEIACIYYYLARSLYCQAELSEDRRSSLYDRAEKCLDKVVTACPLAKADGVVIDMLSSIYASLGRKTEAMDLINAWFETLTQKEFKELGNNIFSMRRAQVNMMRLNLQPSEVIASCEKAEKTDLFSDLCFSWGIADSLLELGNIEQGSSLLKSLVERVEREARTLGREWVLLFLEEILGAQLRHKLWSDAYQTLRSAEYFLESRVGGPPRLNDHLFCSEHTANCLLIVATCEKISDRAIDVLLKAATMCLTFAERRLINTQPLLVAVLSYIFRLITENFSTSSITLERLAILYPKVPDRVKSDHTVLKHLLGMLYTLLNHFCEKLLNDHGAAVRADLLCVAKTFHKELLHPCLFRWVMTIHFMAPPEALSVFDDDAKAEFLSKHSLYGQSREALLFNKALYLYSTGNTEETGHLLWFILTMLNPKRFLIKMCSELIFQIIVTHPYVPAQEYMNPDRFTERHCFATRTGMKAAYNDAIYDFGSLDYKASSITFWRLLFATEFDSVIHKRCIEMLLHGILLGQQLNRDYVINFCKPYACLMGSGEKNNIPADLQ